jgi:hypothetical protein
MDVVNGVESRVVERWAIESNHLSGVGPPP